MCPTWTRIADEAELLAADRALAASTEPDPRERCLLSREAVLLARAAVGARERPTDGWLVHAACEGVVVHADPFVMWGISDVAEQHLRALAADPDVAVDAIDALDALRVVRGMPRDAAPAIAA